jgi:tRNA A37 methylthiotransferase MiaB
LFIRGAIGQLEQKVRRALTVNYDFPRQTYKRQAKETRLSGDGRSVCITFAQGCPRSQIDTALLFRYFRLNGWRLEDNVEDADMILVSTCGVNVSCEQASIRYLSMVENARKNGTQLVVLGCLAGISESELSRRFDAVMVPPVGIEKLDDITSATVKLCQVQDPNYIGPDILRARMSLQALDSEDGNRTWSCIPRDLARRVLIALGLKKQLRGPIEPFDNVYCIRIAHGCLGECSYCAIKFAAGPLRSKPLDAVLSEFDAGLKDGYKLFNIIAGDIGPYGQDIGTNIVDLFKGLLQRDGCYKHILTDINPSYFIYYAPQLTKLFAANSKKIMLCKMPIQSGSERILKLMRRGHTAHEAMNWFRRLRDAAPDIMIATHVLVGFPGETEDDFEDTLSFLRAIRFDLIDVYPYSDRPRIESREFAGKVPDTVKAERISRLRREFRTTAELR